MSAFDTGTAAAVAASPTHDRVARIGDIDMPWRLVRARRRTIAFVVEASGLEVRAPSRVPLAEIEAGIGAKARWIARTWQRVAERAKAIDAARVPWRDGTTVAYRGRTIALRLAGPSGFDGDTLSLDLPADAPTEAIRAATRRWLAAEALRLCGERAAVHAERLGVRVVRMALSNAATRWGSAAADGSIRLHWRLVQLDPELLDAVVAHEVAHLREMNHGPRFWALMALLTADPQGARRRLRAAAASLPPF